MGALTGGGTPKVAGSLTGGGALFCTGALTGGGTLFRTGTRPGGGALFCTGTLAGEGTFSAGTLGGLPELDQRFRGGPTDAGKGAADGDGWNGSSGKRAATLSAGLAGG
jgi:hypothetical protein